MPLELPPLHPGHAGDVNARFLPHVLVVTDAGDGEKEWTVEHPDGCPTVCHWTPHMREAIAEVNRKARESELLRDLDHFLSYEIRDCYVQYELDGVGLDGLDLGVDPPDDGSYTPASPFSMDRWRQLPAGRYVIEGWCRTTYSYEYACLEGDGGLTLVGPEGAA